MARRYMAVMVFLVLGLTSACGTQAGSERDGEIDYSQAPHEIATLAGGCFWCVESAFDGVDGVLEAVSGYTGGEKPNPTYEEVSSGRSGHLEAVRVRYQPDRITYEEILDIFWRQIDPTDAGGQFADRGSQYRTAVFFHDEDQQTLAVITRDALGKSGRFDGSIVTEILPAGAFYAAETYHQDYHLKNPGHYERYRFGSGRTPFLERIWGADVHEKSGSYKKGAFVKPKEEELRKTLTPQQYHVTQEEGTERAFSNEYWDNKAEGLYVDVVSGEPLFSSLDKFESGTGWPSFSKPLEGENIVEKTDSKLFMERTEVRSSQADSHLGHLFPDGPKPTGQRYCVNSAAMRFIPKGELEQEGYGKYLSLFERSSND